jgi:hypothetical protein
MVGTASLEEFVAAPVGADCETLGIEIAVFGEVVKGAVDEASQARRWTWRWDG